MQHPTIVLAIANARQQDIVRQLGSPERIAGRELKRERGNKPRHRVWVDGSVALGRRIARLFPAT